MLNCKHFQISEAGRKEETPWFDGKGGIYKNPDAPCHKCGGKLSPCHDYGDEYICPPCMEKYGGGSVFHQPGTCTDCNLELVKQKKRSQGYECKPCFNKGIEEARNSVGIPVEQILDELAQSMTYKDHEDYELSVIREVGECGKECIWWNNRNYIIARRLRKGKSLTERSDGKQISASQEQVS